MRTTVVRSGTDQIKLRRAREFHTLADRIVDAHGSVPTEDQSKVFIDRKTFVEHLNELLTTTLNKTLDLYSGARAETDEYDPSIDLRIVDAEFLKGRALSVDSANAPRLDERKTAAARQPIRGRAMLAYQNALAKSYNQVGALAPVASTGVVGWVPLDEPEHVAREMARRSGATVGRKCRPSTSMSLDTASCMPGEVLNSFVAQFYDGVAYPGGTRYFGGTQDNGTNRCVHD